MENQKIFDQYIKANKRLTDMLEQEKCGFHASITAVDDDVRTSFSGDLLMLVDGITTMLEDLVDEWSGDEESAPTFGMILGAIADCHERNVINGFSEGIMDFMQNAIEELQDEEDEEQLSRHLS